MAVDVKDETRTNRFRDEKKRDNHYVGIIAIHDSQGMTSLLGSLLSGESPTRDIGVGDELSE